MIQHIIYDQLIKFDFKFYIDIKGTILSGTLDFGLILVKFRPDRDSKKCLQILIESFFR